MDTTANEPALNEPALNESAVNEPAVNEHSPSEHSPSEHSPGESGDDGLLSRVKLIEDQPLASRAAAYGQMHDELRQRLEGTDRQHG